MNGLLPLLRGRCLPGLAADEMGEDASFSWLQAASVPVSLRE